MEKQKKLQLQIKQIDLDQRQQEIDRLVVEILADAVRRFNKNNKKKN